MRLVIDDKIPFIKGVFEQYAIVEYIPGDEIKRKDLIDADGLIIRTRTICNRELLEGTNVKIIATATIGYDHIDTKWFEANGIAWINAAGCNAGSVMQYIAGVLVQLSQKHHINFADRTIGVVGVGNVGKKVVKLAEILGMRIVLTDPPMARRFGPCGFISLEGLLREADIISLHVPLNYEGVDKTHQMFDEAVFSKVMKGSILINSSRGEVVKGDALKNVLKSNHLQAAVLDVWENEPNIDTELLSLLDIATPHIAGYSADGKAKGTAMAVQAISKYFQMVFNQWEPSTIPLPENAMLDLNCKGLNHQEILSAAIEFTYNPLKNDDSALRLHPESFEAYRGKYPLRREFSSYTIQLSNADAEIKQKLKLLGFKIIEK